MVVILALVKRQTALVYLGHTVIFPKTLEKQIKQVKEMLMLLRKAKLTSKLMTCHLFTNTIDILGNVIRPQRFKNASHSTYAVRDKIEPVM